MNIFENDVILNSVNKTMDTGGYNEEKIIAHLISNPIQISSSDYVDVCEFFCVLSGEVFLRGHSSGGVLKFRIINVETNEEVMTETYAYKLQARTCYKLQVSNTSSPIVGTLESVYFEFCVRDKPNRYFFVKQSEV